MDREIQKAFETFRRELKHDRHMVLTLCGDLLGCSPDDVVLRCRKKNGGTYAKEENGEATFTGADQKDG